MRLGLLVLVVAIGGCTDEDKQAILSDCRVKEISIYGPDADAESKMEKQTDFVRTCMRAKGYRVKEWSPSDDACAYFIQQRRNGDCYEKAN